MRRLFGSVQLSKLDTSLLLAGTALLLVALLGRWVTISGNQVLQGAPWWVPTVLGTVGGLAIAHAALRSR